MPKFRKPFFKKSHKAWYVQLDGKQIRLSTDEHEAFARYHQLMAAIKKGEKFQTPSAPEGPLTLGKLMERFERSAFNGRSPKTKAWYREKLAPFISHMGAHFPVEELRPLHVEEYIAAHPQWKKGTARTIWQAIKRLMNWGVRNELVTNSTLNRQKKPGATRRTLVITPEDYAELVALIPGQDFLDLVMMAWETGARPQELLKLEARHWDKKLSRMVLPAEEAKGNQWPRIIYLSEEAAKIVERRLLKASSVVFTTAAGKPWTQSALNGEWRRLRERIGLARIKKQGISPKSLLSEEDIAQKIATLSPTRVERGATREKTHQELREEATRKLMRTVRFNHAPKYCLYNFRHSWLDRMLKSGVDVLTCAILLGHRSPEMIARHYQHLSQSPEYLRKALEKGA